MVHSRITEFAKLPNKVDRFGRLFTRQVPAKAWASTAKPLTNNLSNYQAW